MPDVVSVAVKDSVTEVEIVESAALFIRIRPFGAVLSNLIWLSILCGSSSLSSASTLQYSSVFELLSTVIWG